MRILFICHGNICRSPMAEFIFIHLARQAGCAELFDVASAAVSDEETGNDIYPPAKRKLTEKGIPFTRRAARRITRADYDSYDHIICMDRSNIRLLRYILGFEPELLDVRDINGSLNRGAKVSLMMHWADLDRDVAPKGDFSHSLDVADPWYTGDYEATYSDLIVSCTALLRALSLKHNG